jgi:plastocyanin
MEGSQARAPTGALLDHSLDTMRVDISHSFAADSTDLGLQKPGATLTYKFDKAGAYMVRCSIHPSVQMAVSVK